MKKIALYGGTFSPPHIGHASVIEAILRLFPCDEIWVMPSADRHDKTASAQSEHRLKMLRTMIGELFPNPNIPMLVSDFEIRTNKPTVTYETLQALKKEYPDHEFYFVLGSENLENIKTKWINGEKLLQENNFLAIRNPFEKTSDNLPVNITILEDVVWLETSSTFIRDLIKNDYSGLPYLTKGVSEYIKQNNLYK